MEMSSAMDSNVFSWPLFPVNTDWQLDFDIPFIAGHTSASTGASSATLPELDPYELYNRPTQGLDSAGYAGDWVEDIRVSEKVSIDPTRWVIRTLTRSRGARLELF